MAEPEASMSRPPGVKPRTLITIALVIGLVTAVLFAMGAFEARERTLYDRALRATAADDLHRGIRILAISPEDFDAHGNIQAGKLTPILDALREAGATGFAVNEPVAGNQTGIRELALAAALHPVAVFSYQYEASDRVRLERGDPPIHGISVPEPLTEAATAIAFNERLAGPDGVLRRFSPVVEDRLEVGAAVAGAVQPNVQLPQTAPTLGDERFLGPGPRLLIRYDRDPADAVYMLPEDVMEGDVDLRGKTVVIGRADPGAISWKTPVGDMKDVEVTAQIGSALALGRGITRAPAGIVFFATVLGSLVMVIGASRRHPALDLALPLAAALIIWGIAEPSMRVGRWIDAVPLLIVLGAHAFTLPVVRQFWGGDDGSNRGVERAPSREGGLSPASVTPRDRGQRSSSVVSR